MFNCECKVCNKIFKAETAFSTICSSVCSMRRYRQTDKGKESVKECNKRYKRPDINRTCLHCNREYVTARKNQVLCSTCSLRFASRYAQRKHRSANPAKVRARGVIDKAIQRGIVRMYCVVCGSRNTHAHHPDYNYPYKIIWLCPLHHTECHNKAKNGISAKEYDKYIARKLYRFDFRGVLQVARPVF